MDQNSIESKLRKVIYDRGRFTAWPNLFFAIVSVGISEKMLFTDYTTSIGLLAVTIGTIIRILLMNSTKNPIYINEKRWILLHLSVILIGLGWGLNYIFVHLFYGLESNESLYSMLIVVGIISGGITSLSPAPKLYYSYLISALIIPMAHFIYDYSEPGHLLIAVFIIILSIFNLYNATMSHELVKNYVSSDQKAVEQRDKLQTLINTVPGFVSFIDEEMRYQNINQFGKLFYNEIEIIGKRVGHIHPDSDFSRFVTNFMNSTKEQHTGELKIEIGTHSSWFIVSIKRITTNPKGAVIVSVPINELVDMRKDLEAQQAKAHYAAKLASLGEMAASIAHEINNPLAIIQGSAEQLSRNIDKENSDINRSKQLSNKIIETTERISKIVRSLKTLSRNGDKDPFKDFLLMDVISDCVEVTKQNFHEKQINLQICEIPADLKLNGQQVQISQVLMNMINNAFHAIEPSEAPKWIKIDLEIHPLYLDIKISDSGPGIPQSIREKIMEPFFTTKDVGKGTGLGLSISKAIIENHGGSLKLDEEASNTTFVISLPMKSS